MTEDKNSAAQPGHIGTAQSEPDPSIKAILVTGGLGFM